MPLSPTEFIETTFLDQYKDIIYKHKYYYIGFALVCIAIEFVGKCLDATEQDWQAVGRSKHHFKAAVEQMMPRYKPFSELLYKHLRSGFAHGLLPGPEVALTHRDESLQYGTKHLTVYQGVITVVIEDFYDDLEAACRTLLQRQFPQGDKMNRPLLKVPSDTVVGGRPLNARTTPY